MNWHEFLHMGGYAFHVWTSWGLTLLVIIGFIAQPKLSNAKLRREIKRQLERDKLAEPDNQNHTKD